MLEKRSYSSLAILYRSLYRAATRKQQSGLFDCLVRAFEDATRLRRVTWLVTKKGDRKLFYVAVAGV